MEKKGRKRWFVLRNNHLYWYKAVQEVSHIRAFDPHAEMLFLTEFWATQNDKEATGSLDLKECSVKKLDEKLKGKSALLISSSSRGDYLLLHQDEDEIDSWVKALIEKGGASKYTAQSGAYGGSAAKGGSYFGLSLQDLLQKEGRGNGIPILVEKCVDYIRQVGMEAEGIFRVSGEQIDIVAFKQEFENTSDVNTINFPTSTASYQGSRKSKLAN